MNTPLYKRMKERGTSFYVFPSAAEDLNLSTFQNLIKMNFTKFILLDIPAPISYVDDEHKVVLAFDKTDTPDSSKGQNFYNFDKNTNQPTIYSEKLIESLRNYVANNDASFRNSKISTNKNFYNATETKTPSEMIFWKWCKKLNLIDFEPAAHKIDWDKNLPDFDNPNANVFSSIDYFRKYLWKERDVNYYGSGTTASGDSGNVEFTLNYTCKFKPNDFIMLSGITGSGDLTYDEYLVLDVTFPTVGTTTITIDHIFDDTNNFTQCYLSYHRFVQYIGEVQATSKVQASQQNFTEFTAQIPAHCGQSPNILFSIDSNLNYYPDLELPLISEQIQPEILGAEYLASPIRTNPENYPGSYFGYFDTVDKTYLTSSGDKLRLNGDYYGINLTSNVGLNLENYIEKLTDFDASNIDGVNIDFDYLHYYKLATSKASNFDEFNSISINGNAPSDFQFNAILWYYEITDSKGKVSTNLFGIEFLNNPKDDFGQTDDNIIQPFQKLVTNENQDGLSYIFNLNLDFKVDNDMLPLTYDPTSIYNIFGFDLYNNIMSNYGKLNESFLTIISEFIRINQELTDMKSLIWSQTDIDSIKQRLDNFDQLLRLYSTFQFVNSETVTIDIDYSHVYPAIKLKANAVDYENIYNLYSDDILSYGLSYSGDSTVIYVPQHGKFLINIFSNIINNFTGETLSITLDKDLAFKQSCDIIIRPDISVYTNKLNLYVMYDDGYANHNLAKSSIIEDVYMPISISQSSDYDSVNPTGSTYGTQNYYNVKSYISQVTTTTTGATITVNDAVFKPGDYAYIDSFYFRSGNTTEVYDYSGLYYLSGLTSAITGFTNQLKLYYNLDTPLDLRGMGLILMGSPSIFYYLGMKISILRISDDDYSSLNTRYAVSKEFLTSDSLLRLI